MNLLRIWCTQAQVRRLSAALAVLMLAVPGWLDSHSVPKPVAVVNALKSTARDRLDCRKLCPPARHAMTK